MTKEEFKKLEDHLIDEGYKIYNGIALYNENYHYAKSFHKKDNKWEEDRAGYQILLCIYDWNELQYPSIPKELRNKTDIEITILVSRTGGERIDLKMAWHDDTTIEEVEAQAEEFYKWVNFVWFEPREEK